MRTIVVSAVVLAVSSFAALAASEGKFSKATVDKVNAALESVGCKGGELFPGYEVGGADCADGKYNVKIDKDTFAVTDKKKKE